jgi:uncharacterized protein (TIGR02453 family)
MIQQSTLDFLKKLKKNNNKEWFDKHKGDYEAAKEDLTAFIEKVIASIGAFDPSVKHLTPKDCMFRIYRDVRFAKDKTPYKSHLGAYISGRGKKSNGPGYYLHIQPGNSFLAGGLWVPPSNELSAVRQEIDYNHEEFEAILKEKNFKKYFKNLDQGEKLKTLPKGYDKDHPAIELLKLKSFTVTYKVDDKIISSKEFLKHSTTVFKAMKPLHDFLDRALD